MTTVARFPAAPQSAPFLDDEQRFVLSNVTWEQYAKIGEQFADRPALRITYDRGRLEFMTTSPRHERYKHWLGRFLETVAKELQTPIMPGGSMTFQAEAIERGFEPDQCFWIAHEPAVRAKLTWEPEIDPPPDLMIEIEVSRSAMDRMSIFAAFRIPEIWCCDGEELRIYHLKPDGAYQRSATSLAFPPVQVCELIQFFPFASSDYLGAVAACREWVRSQIHSAS